jgi:uncharacterized RDD family membrane protein YckC
MKASMRTMDKILVLLGIIALLFTVTMIVIYVCTGGIPDTLCTCVFSAIFGECGIMGWIRTTKDKRQDRAWEVQDREEMKNA